MLLISTTDTIPTFFDFQKISTQVFHHYTPHTIIILLGLTLIVILIIYSAITKKNNNKYKIKQQILQENNIDWNNTMLTFKAQDIYNKLKKTCHPDRFLDPQKNLIATELFQQITKHKTNYKELLKLKEEAKEKLNINI